MSLRYLPGMAFTGFPAEAFEFYERLEVDNSKAFWQANRDVYERAVKGPYAELSAELASSYGPMHLFRPYRDVRFSKDKTPYKNHAGGVTESEGGVAHYVQLEAARLFVGTGMYHLAADQLERWRDAVGDDRTGTEIADIAGGLRTDGFDIGAMESLKTAPRGWPKDHPRIDLLRIKGLTMGRGWPLARWMHSAKAIDRIREVFERAAPMNGWLERHVGPSTLPPREFG